MTGAESLLCSLLDCGVLDLAILDDVGYDLGEIAEALQDSGIKPSLNAITVEIFYKGIEELTEALKNKINELAYERGKYNKDSDEYEKLQEQINELEYCNPEEDVDWFCNCLDTSIWFSQNEEIYRKYLEDEISEIEDNMGFEF